MKKMFLALTTLTFFVTLGASADFTSVSGTTITSLARLIAEPDQYSGKRVQIAGYYAQGFEESSLYLTKESAEIHDQQAAVWVDVSRVDPGTLRHVGTGYAKVVGVFRTDPRRGAGHLGLWPSSLEDVSLIVPVKRAVHLPMELFCFCGLLLALSTCALFWVRGLKRSQKR